MLKENEGAHVEVYRKFEFATTRAYTGPNVDQKLRLSIIFNAGSSFDIKNGFSILPFWIFINFL